MHLIVEGWRGIPHSFCLVNQFLSLQWLTHSGLRLSQRERPYHAAHWKRTSGLLGPAQEAALSAIPTARPKEPADVVLRLFVPYDLTPDRQAARTFVWGTTELGIVQNEMFRLMGVTSLAQLQTSPSVILITCSHWSREGFIRSGALPEQVRVVPLGVDPTLFRPLPAEERLAQRRREGIADGTFLFMNVGMMTKNKGTHLLLKAFAVVAERHPQARLLLKGLEPLGPSVQMIGATARACLTAAEMARVEGRIIYLGESISTGEMARLYQLADAYVSPYLAEGFNLPVLEAAACGLPVICTEGGPTDDFTTPEFALGIRSKVVSIVVSGETRYVCDPDVNHLLHRMESVLRDPGIAARAREAGPRHIAARYTWAHVAEQFLEVFRPGQRDEQALSPVSTIRENHV